MPILNEYPDLQFRCNLPDGRKITDEADFRCRWHAVLPQLSPEKLLEILLHGTGLKPKGTVVIGRTFLMLDEIKLYKDEAQKVVEKLTFTLKPGEREATLMHIMIEPGYRGGGYGSAIVKSLGEIAARVGIPKISLTATQIGSYAFIKMGFLPDEDTWKSLQADIRARLDSFSEQLKTLDCEKTEYEIREMLKGNHPSAIQAIAGINQPCVKYNDAVLPLGAALLVDLQWQTSLMLGSENRHNAYVVPDSFLTPPGIHTR